jgi:hypothetical protein
LITEVLIDEFMRTVVGAREAMNTDPGFHMQVCWTRLVLVRLEEVLRLEGCDPWGAERVMRAVLGTMEDPCVALQRVGERAVAVQRSMLN